MTGQEFNPLAIDKSKPTNVCEQQTADGVYVMPLHPVTEGVKRALGLPIFYTFCEKKNNKLRYYRKQVR